MSLKKPNRRRVSELVVLYFGYMCVILSEERLTCIQSICSTIDLNLLQIKIRLSFMGAILTVVYGYDGHE